MKKYINLKCLAFVLICVIPSFTHAASVYIEPVQKNINEGDVVILDVKINSEKSLINAVEGSVTLDTSLNLSVRELSLAGSIFSLWPKSPVISSDGKTISFVGGVPSGFNSDNVTIFKIVLEAKKAGQVNISPKNITAYVNDGKGTKTQVKTTDSIIVISKKGDTPLNDEWKSLMSSDTVPPEDFVITIGQESSMFDGKKFAFFTAVDSQTGIDYYEVYEGTKEVVRSGNMYVLQDQNNISELKVVAYDKVGNKKTSIYIPESKTKGDKLNYYIISIIFTILILLTIIKLFRRKYNFRKGEYK